VHCLSLKYNITFNNRKSWKTNNNCKYEKEKKKYILKNTQNGERDIHIYNNKKTDPETQIQKYVACMREGKILRDERRAQI
jgi:beta-glucanase (GH16 family)